MEFTWSVSKLISAKSENGFDDVVKTIYWNYKITDVDYESNIQGVLEMGPPNEFFVPYNGLTEQIVLDWVKNVVDENALQSALINEMNYKKNPPLIELPLPWLDPIIITD